MIELTLPFPPSVNHYWKARVVPGGQGRESFVSFYVSKEGKQFSEDVAKLCMAHKVHGMKLDGELVMLVGLYPPDLRARDVDNYNKALLDSLTNAEVWQDDKQVKRLIVDMLDASPTNPRAVIKIEVRQVQGRLA